MACSCSGGKNWVVTRPDGGKAFYSTQVEAAADVARNGGTYTQNG